MKRTKGVRTICAKPMRFSPDSGQAAVETAITLPLTLFMVLGGLQLFMMMQARLLAHYALFKAARAGSLNYGDCNRMRDSAVAALLPAFARVDTPVALGAEFGKLRGNGFKYQSTWLTPYTGPVMWLGRDLDQIAPNNQAQVGPVEDTFDIPLGGIANVGSGASGFTLVAKMVFWYPLKVPFANRVMSRIVLAAWGAQAYSATNPYIATQTASWQQDPGKVPVSNIVLNELKSRAANQEYVFPISAHYSMRMMTPPRVANGVGIPGPCPPAPANF
jgi:hypothetical protein